MDLWGTSTSLHGCGMETLEEIYSDIWTMFMYLCSLFILIACFSVI